MGEDRSGHGLPNVLSYPAEDHASGSKSPPFPVFDRAAFLTWVMDDEDMAFAAAEIFLGSMPVQIANLASAIEAGDCGQAAYRSHTIKGASANVGGEALRTVALEMEKAAETGDLPMLRTLLPRMEACFALLKEAMKEEFRL